jgi:hypothetical protein
MVEELGPPRDLAVVLEALPRELHAQRKILLELEQGVRTARETLKDREAVIILGGSLNDKTQYPNAEAREAKLREATARERLALEDAQDRLEWAKIDLLKLLDEFSALRSLVRLFAAEGD